MSNCVQEEIREVSESFVSESVCMSLSEVCGGTYNGSLLEKLNTPMDTVHYNV